MTELGPILGGVGVREEGDAGPGAKPRSGGRERKAGEANGKHICTIVITALATFQQRRPNDEKQVGSWEGRSCAQVAGVSNQTCTPHCFGSLASHCRTRRSSTQARRVPGTCAQPARHMHKQGGEPLETRSCKRHLCMPDMWCRSHGLASHSERAWGHHDCAVDGAGRQRSKLGVGRLRADVREEADIEGPKPVLGTIAQRSARRAHFSDPRWAGHLAR